MKASTQRFLRNSVAPAVRLVAGGFIVLTLLVAGASVAVAAATIIPAVNNGAYTYSAAVEGLNAASNTHDFSVNAWRICRYIDVHTVPGVANSVTGLLIPFASDPEWRGVNTGGNATGFIATSGMRPYVTLDFCRPSANFPKVDYAGPGGLSDPHSVVGGQAVVRPVDLPQKRVDAQHDDGSYMVSLRDSAAPASFNMQREDCLSATTYPDGSVHKPCYTWSWTETVTAGFRFDNGMTRAQALQELHNPQNSGAGHWVQSLSRTCGDLAVKANDGRETVATASCPPAVTPPVLRDCKSAQHNQRYWSPATAGNVQALHDCAANTVEGPARQRYWDTEAEYLCFDGKDYPTGTTRPVNVRVTGTCTPVVQPPVIQPPIVQPPVVQPPVPQCAPFTETRAGICPAGQTGSISEARQRNVGNACGVDSGWSMTASTCAVAPTCTQSFETRNSSCPAGSSGTVVEQRLTNIGNVCNANGNWAAFSSNCASCTSVSTVTLNCTAAGLNGSGFVTSRTVNNTCDATQATTYTANSGCCKPGLPRSQSVNVNGIMVPGCN